MENEFPLEYKCIISGKHQTFTTFLRTSKMVIRFNVLVFLRCSASKMFLSSMEHSYPTIAKISPDFNISL